MDVTTVATAYGIGVYKALQMKPLTKKRAEEIILPVEPITDDTIGEQVNYLV